jgi:hypothetical protein
VFLNSFEVVQVEQVTHDSTHNGASDDQQHVDFVVVLVLLYYFRPLLLAHRVSKAVNLFEKILSQFLARLQQEVCCSVYFFLLACLLFGNELFQLLCNPIVPEGKAQVST